MNFEGVNDLQPVADFYASVGATFSANALGLVDSDAGGSGNIAGEPSLSTVMFWTEGGEVLLTHATGFTNKISFWYAAPFATGNIIVNKKDLSGENIQLVARLLPLTPSNPIGVFSPFEYIEVLFDGVAHSVAIQGGLNQIAFDDITLGDLNLEISIPSVSNPSCSGESDTSGDLDTSSKADSSSESRCEPCSHSDHLDDVPRCKKSPKRGPAKQSPSIMSQETNNYLFW